MGLRTPLFESHAKSGATLVDFGGWDMPLHYGSQLAEHRAVRAHAGMFDVSHMGIIDLSGARTRDFLRMLLANDVAQLNDGGALYSCMLLPSGGVVDDFIVYRLSAARYRLVVNAGTRERDIAWIERHALGWDLQMHPRTDLAMIAIQGPEARVKTATQLPAALREPLLALRNFTAAQLDSWFVARTGYTGEDGFEVILPAAGAAALWQGLATAGVQPAGLGARDTLRLEAGMNLYGNDMDERRNPLESGLEWTVAFDPAAREFVGRSALEQARTAGTLHLIGLVLEQRGMLRSHQRVTLAVDATTAVSAVDTAAPPGSAVDAVAAVPNAVGEVTSGTFSPTLNRSIALARVPRVPATRAYVDIRGRAHTARIVKPPFVRRGRALVDLNAQQETS